MALIILKFSTFSLSEFDPDKKLKNNFFVDMENKSFMLNEKIGLTLSHFDVLITAEK